MAKEKLNWNDYEYSGEPAGGGWLYFNLFRTHGCYTEEYNVETDSWEYNDDAHKAHYGYMFTTRMSSETALRLKNEWRNNYLNNYLKQKGKEKNEGDK